MTTNEQAASRGARLPACRWMPAALLALAAAPAVALTPSQLAAARADGSLRELRLAGSSSMRHLLASYLLTELADPATFDVYFDSPAGANHRAYAFRTKLPIGGWPAGTPLLVTKRDLGGSLQGIRPLLNGGDASQQHMLVDQASCMAAVGGVSPAQDIEQSGFVCSATLSAKADAGLSDIDPKIVTATINGGINEDTSSLTDGTSGLSEFVHGVYGIAVNNKLYLALQKAQGLISLSATVPDDSPAAQPSLPRQFIAGALTGQMIGSSATSNKGWNLVIPAGVDPNISNKRINVCRRIPGSGAQALSNLYLLNNPCGGSANQFTPITGTPTATLAATGSLTTLQNSSTGAVEACLASVDNLADSTGGAYGFGVMSLSNNPNGLVNGVAVERNYRFVRLSQAAPTRDSVNKGDYDFVWGAYLFWPRPGELNAPDADKLALLAQMRQRMGTATVLAKMKPDLQEGFLALPSTFTGPWSTLDPVTRSFTGHANRIADNACSPIRMTK